MPITTYVPSPPPRSRWPGLVTSVGGEAAIADGMSARPSEGGPDRWEQGYETDFLVCNNDEVAVAPTCDDTEVFEPRHVIEFVERTPLLAWEGVVCNTRGRVDVEARARELLTTTQSHQVERELWTGAGATAAAIDEQHLASSDATILAGGSPIALVHALAALQGAGAALGQGERLAIHCTPATAALWYAAGAIRHEGAILLDAFDNLVVAGTGYPGSSPTGVVDASGNTAWAYVTTVPVVRLGAVQDASFTDRAANRNEAYAWRAFGVTWHCVHVGVNVDLCNVCCTTEEP